MDLLNKKRIHKGALKAISAVCAVLILVSMLYVGNVINLEADAISANSPVYFGFYGSTGDDCGWWDDNCEIGVWAWNNSGGQKYYRLNFVYHDGVGDGDVYRFIPDMTITGFKMLRFWGEDESFTTLDRVTDFNKILVGTLGTDGGRMETTDLSADGYSSANNCFYLKRTDGTENGYYESWGSKPVFRDQAALSLKGGNSMSASVGYQTGSGSYEVSGTKLYPVQAKFYDYLTDYELEKGWRTNDDYETSRTYLHRMPYTRFNSYISGLTGGVQGNWTYPLYFGNITSDWTSFSSYPYGTLVDKYIYSGVPSNVESYYAMPSGKYAFLRHDSRISNYTDQLPLHNFSVFANDSEGCKYTSEIDNYSGSVQGLVMNELKNGKLYMTTKDGAGIESPYFNDSANEYINTVSTQFPMRINDTNKATGTNYTYTTYEFDSKGKGDNNNDGANKDTGAPDIVYFTYGSDGKPDKIMYTRDKSKQVIDAFKSLGGNDSYDDGVNGGNHRGFFPFDEGKTNSNGVGTTVAHDYGFGMRLDIDFNLTKDGCILGKDAQGALHKTSDPMKFEFEGDDDVWVFVDGKLALDLGGDHGNAKGDLSFALNDVKANVSTGAVTLSPSPVYGQSEFAGNVTYHSGSSTGKNVTVFDASAYDADGNYDVTKKHTLTVFYMERGLVESNLKLSFSVSPLGNELSVDKTVKTDNVNSALKTRVENYLGGTNNSEAFDFEVDDGSGRTVYEVEKNNVNCDYVYEDDLNSTKKGITVNDGEEVFFHDQITDDANVKVTERPQNSCIYSYDTTYTVKDNVKNSNTVSNAAATSPQTKGGGSVNFAFKSTPKETGAERYNDFSVSAVNNIKTADVKIHKTINGSSTQDTFAFEVYIMLPHENDFPIDPDATVSVKTNETKTVLSGVPVGSTVRFVEKLTNAQKLVYLDYPDGQEYSLTASGLTAEYVNEKFGEAEITAEKKLDGSSSTTAFDFALTPLDARGAKNGAALTTRNKTDGTAKNVVFSVSGLESGVVYNYILEETSTTDDLYECDTALYWVTVDTNEGNSVKYFNASKNGSVYTKGSAVTTAVFENTSKPQFGDVEVIKKNAEGSMLSGVTVALVPAAQDGNKWVPMAGSAVVTSRTVNGIAAFSDVTPGNYVVYETKSIEPYELAGEYYHVNVTAGRKNTVTITDTTTPEIPRTGGVGVVFMILIGAALIAVGIFMLRPSKKEKQ